MEEGKSPESDSSTGDIQEFQDERTSNDDKIIETLVKDAIVLPSTAVRQRQQTCSFKEIKKDELPTFAKDFFPARRMTLQQMIKKDKTDESLEKYKKDLIGEVDDQEIARQEPVEVEIVSIEVVCKDRPDGNIILDFTDPKAKKNEEQFIIKEGSVYFMRVHFRVRYDCVYGLKFVNNVWRHFIKVDKYEETMGCFSPKKEIQTIDLLPEEAPTGIFGRGTYKGKIMVIKDTLKNKGGLRGFIILSGIIVFTCGVGQFSDHDGIVHMQFEYKCKIASKWTD